MKKKIKLIKNNNINKNEKLKKVKQKIMNEWIDIFSCK